MINCSASRITAYPRRSCGRPTFGRRREERARRPAAAWAAAGRQNARLPVQFGPGMERHCLAEAGWITRRSRSGGSSRGAETDTAPGSSNAARFLAAVPPLRRADRRVRVVHAGAVRRQDRREQPAPGQRIARRGAQPIRPCFTREALGRTAGCGGNERRRRAPCGAGGGSDPGGPGRIAAHRRRGRCGHLRARDAKAAERPPDAD